MIARVIRYSILAALILGIGVLGSNTKAADEEKKTEDKTTSTPSTGVPIVPVGPTFITVGDLVGKVTKVDATSITVQVEWFTANPAKPPANYGKWARGTSSRNPKQMMQHQIQMQHQMQIAQAKANAKGPKENHIDYTMNFTSDAIARIKHLPPKDDKTPYTALEVQQAKGNPMLPGYKSDLSALKVGQYIEAHVVKAPGTKDTKESMMVRWGLILNDEHAKDTPPTSTSSKNPKKN